MLSVVPKAVVVCAPWHLRGFGEPCADDGNHPKGGQCTDCGRDIAVPHSAAGEPICLYCGMERGIVPIEDKPWWTE